MRYMLIALLLLLIALPVGGQTVIDNVCFLGGAFGWSERCSTEDEWTAGYYIYHHGYWWAWNNLPHLRPAMQNKPQPAAQITFQSDSQGESQIVLQSESQDGSVILTADVEDEGPGEQDTNSVQSGCISGQSGYNSFLMGFGSSAGYQIVVITDANGCSRKTVMKKGRNVLSAWVGRNIDCISDEVLLKAAETGTDPPICWD